MDWFKKHFDRVILAVLAVSVIVFAGLIIMRVTSFSESFATRNSIKKPNNNVPFPATELVKERIATIEKPKDWGAYDGSLFVSKPFVSLNGANPINPLEDEKRLFSDIPNEWVGKYNLDFADPNLPNADPDADKFSNMEELRGGTNPTDAKSMPPYFTKLRLLQFIQVPFRLKFSGSPDEGVYSINTMDLKQPTQFLRIGEMVTGTPYKLVAHTPKKLTENEMEKDISELTIENQETGQKIVLIYDRAVNDPTVYALFKYLWDGSEIKVKKNDSFSIKPEATIKYKLIDISDVEAVIESPQGAKIKIPKGDS